MKLDEVIKMFLIYKEWGHSTDLDEFYNFVQKQGVKVEYP